MTTPNLSVSLHNINTFVPIKLAAHNHILWKTFFKHVLSSLGLEGLIEGTDLCPEKYIIAEIEGNITTTPNPEYANWMKRDQTLFLLINATVSEAILPYLVGFQSSKALWDALESRFSTLSRSHILQLKARLQGLKKGDSSMIDYLQKIKQIADSLAAAGTQISDCDLILHTLQGLPNEYESFTTSIMVRVEPVSAEELHNLLLSHELTIENRMKTLTMMDPTHQAFSANYSNNRGRTQSYGRGQNRGRRGFYNNRGGRSYNNPSTYTPNHSNSSFPTNHSSYSSSNTFSPFNHHQQNTQTSTQGCQISGRNNHTALDCYNRMSLNFKGKIPPTKLAAMASSSNYTNHPTTPSSQQSQWIADSGATHHAIPDIQNLYHYSDYEGTDAINVASGEELPILHTGHQIKENPPSRPQSQWPLHNS